MREVVKSVDCNCCKIEIFFPSLSKVEIDLMVQFLYTGKISNLSANRTVISEVLDNLTKLLGFPNCLQSTRGKPVVPIFMKETNTVLNVFQEVESVSIKQKLASKSADHKLCPESQEELNQKHELQKITDIISEKDEAKDQYQNSSMDLSTTYSAKKQVKFDENMGLFESIEFEEKVELDENMELDDIDEEDLIDALDEIEFDEKIEFDNKNLNFDEKVDVYDKVEFDEAIEFDQKIEVDESIKFGEIEEDTNDALDDLSSSLEMPNIISNENGKGNENIIQGKAMVEFEELNTTNDSNKKEKDGFIESINTLEPLNTSSPNSDQTENEIHEEKVRVENEAKSADLFDLSEDQLKVETTRKPKEFHKEKSVKSYKCNYCNAFFSIRSNLKRHQIGSCTKGFTPQADLMELKCSRCKRTKTFSTQSELDEHITLVHEGKSENSYECDHCHIFFSTKSNLSRHILRNCSSGTKSTSTKPYGNLNELREVLDDSINEETNQAENDSDEKEIHEEFSVKTEIKPAVDLADGEEQLKVKSEKFSVNPESHKHTSACYSSKWSNQNSNLCPLLKDPLLNSKKHCEVSDGKKSNKNLKIPESLEVEKQTPKCEYCLKTFGQYSTLNRHLRKSCKNVPKSPKTKRISKRLASAETFHQCSTCNLSFSKESHLIKHQKEEHEIFNKKEERKKMFKCKYCEKMIANRFNLWKHLQNTCTSDPNRFELIRQMRIEDVTEKRYKCKYCNKTFVERNILRRHLRQICTSDPNRFELVSQMKIENVTILRFQCTKCDRSYSTKGALKNHNLIHEGNRKKYDCSLCDKQFFSQAAVDQHILAVHEGKKPHLCSQCGHSTANKSNLKMHIEHVHEGKKPFPCDQCDKRYRQRCELKNHVSRSHEKNKPFKCSVCSHSFANKAELDQHGDVHTNIRPYPCTICEDKFKRSHHLVTHLKTIHNVAKKDWKI